MSVKRTLYKYSTRAVLKMGLSPSEFRIIDRFLEDSTHPYKRTLEDFQGNQLRLISYTRNKDLTVGTNTVRAIECVRQSVENRPKMGLAGQLSDLKVVRHYGSTTIPTDLRDGNVIEPGIVFLTLVAQVLSVDMEYSCEGHPRGFYAVFGKNIHGSGLYEAIASIGSPLIYWEARDRFHGGEILRTGDVRTYQTRNRLIAKISRACETLLKEKGIILNRAVAINELGATPITFTV